MNDVEEMVDTVDAHIVFIWYMSMGVDALSIE